MDIEAAIQFLLEQQARHESRQQEFDVNIAKLNEGLLRVNEMVLQTNANLVHVSAAQERANEILVTLAERQVKTEEALSALTERQIKTEESLSSVMLVVERHIANHDQ